MHVDHFCGFDRLLRLLLNRDARLVLAGPPGLADVVEAKLRAYSWNLLDATSPDFRLSPTLDGEPLPLPCRHEAAPRDAGRRGCFLATQVDRPAVNRERGLDCERAKQPARSGWAPSG